MTSKNNDFILLVTGVSNNDEAVKYLLGGNAQVVSFKMRYTPPYEKFKELKSFQLKTKYRPFKPRCEYAAVDISEWVGHEEEEYFETAMKFFHDHNDVKYVFTVGNSSKEAIQALYIKASLYMRGRITEDKTLTQSNELGKHILANYRIDEQSASLLADLFVKSSRLHGYAMLNMMMRELQEQCNDKRITMTALSRCVSREDSFVGLFYGESLKETPSITKGDAEYEKV
jgi:hypothetical protein